MTQPPGPYYYYRPAPLPQPLSPAGVPLADFGTRVLAYLIDIALLSAAITVVALPATVIFLFRVLPGPGGYLVEGTFSDFDIIVRLLLFEAGLVLFTLLCYYAYAVEFMHRTGQTVGKKLMKIRVVPLDPARRLTRGMATKRYLVEYLVGTFVPFFHYLDGLWLLWDKPYLQTLHDKAARTVVVKVSP